MGRLLLFLLIFGVLAIPAKAADLGELTPLGVRGSVDCGGPTGAPGELVVRTATGVRFVTATRTGFQFGQAVDIGKGFTCSAVKVRPSGAGVIAGELNGRVVAVVRDPGGAWGAPLPVAPVAGVSVTVSLSADVSDRGDVIVAVKAFDLDTRSPQTPLSRFFVSRRAPGGTFGAAEQLGDRAMALGDIHAGIAATGEAVVVTTLAPKHHQPPFQVPVEARLASPGGTFGAPVHIADTRVFSSPALAVAADGRALIAAASGASMVVAERAPGAGFGAATPVGSAGEGGLVTAQIGIAPDGAAAVSWARLLPGDLQIVTRTAPGAFSPAVRASHITGLFPADYDPFYASESFFAAISPFGAFISGAEKPLTLTPDGRAVLAVGAGTRTTMTTVPLAGGPIGIASSGRGFTTSGDASALLLADGTPAVTWTHSSGFFESLLTGRGRYDLHLAAEGIVERPDPPAPRVTVGAPKRHTVGDEPLRLPIRCSAACEVEAAIGSNSSSDSVRMTGAGRGTLKLTGSVLDIPKRLGPVRIELSYGAPGALHPRERTVTLQLKRDASLKLPQVSALRAHRAGNRIRVTFHASRTSDETRFYVSGDDTRGWSGEPRVTKTVAATDKREYTLSLPADGVRYVTVRVADFTDNLQRRVVAVQG